MSELVLGIETSCDETAAAVVDGGRTIVSSVVSSQIDLHAHYGGVVPEIAGHAHLEQIIPIVEQALVGAGLCDDDGRVKSSELAGIAATVGPGLVGSLLVGVSAAKSLALSWHLPFVGVNHLEGHLHAAFLEEQNLSLPVVVLLASGGHTMIIFMDHPGSYEILGETVDDAAGEAFDKVARYLDLGYPGGPVIEKVAMEGDASAIAFPRPLSGIGTTMSFSGLKTAVVAYVKAHPEVATPDVAASFQAAVIDVLVEKAMNAAQTTGARGVCLAGGVAANGPLREAVILACKAKGLETHIPSRAMCTDNAAMIAAAGYHHLQRGETTSWAIGAQPGLKLVGTGTSGTP